MKRRYYMRGIGISMIVTAILMGVATGGKESLSDEEIKKRALQLGMVEEKATVLSDLKNQESTSPTIVYDEDEKQESESIAESTEPAESEEVPESTEPTESEEVPESTEATESEEVPESTEPTESEEVPESTEPDESTEEAGSTDAAEAVAITVVKGDSSVSVSRDLEEAGLVESAKDFDRYLCNNGYDKRISVGTYEIPYGTSEEEIAKIITRSR